jgi:hypothetical protein
LDAAATQLARTATQEALQRRWWMTNILKLLLLELAQLNRHWARSLNRHLSSAVRALDYVLLKENGGISETDMRGSMSSLNLTVSGT